ncbi:MAG: hypothetical protein L0Z62_15405 [Gemmataceae bacterium]|nr:hypothetical protein [Gemmataceae bacterium]
MRTTLKLLAASALCLAGSPRAAVAQESHHCEWLLKYGIYDTIEWHFDRYSIGHLRTLLKVSKAETYEDFEKEGASFGINVPALASINFGGHGAKTNFRQWKAALLAATDFGAQEHENLRVVVRKISPTLMATVQKCLDNPPKGMLVGWLRPSKDDLTFTLHLKHNPAVRGAAKVTSVSFRSSTRGPITPLAGKEADLVKEGSVIPITGVSVQFQREKPTEGITIVVNTTRGPKELEVPAVNPNEVIDRLNRRVTELEKPVGPKANAAAEVIGVWDLEFTSLVPSAGAPGWNGPERITLAKGGKFLFEGKEVGLWQVAGRVVTLEQELKGSWKSKDGRSRDIVVQVLTLSPDGRHLLGVQSDGYLKRGVKVK